MMAALILLAVLLAVAIAALAAVALRSQLAPGPSLAGKTVVVHTRDEQSVRGVLAAEHADRLSLRAAVYLHGEDEQPIGGLAHVPVRNIAWMQEIAPPEAG